MFLTDMSLLADKYNKHLQSDYGQMSVRLFDLRTWWRIFPNISLKQRKRRNNEFEF